MEITTGGLKNGGVAQWTVKYNNVYIKGYETIKEAAEGVTEFFEYYNEQRLHSSLGDKCPDMVYYGNNYQDIHNLCLLLWYYMPVPSTCKWHSFWGEDHSLI